MANVFADIKTAAQRGEFQTTYNFGSSAELEIIAKCLSDLGYYVIKKLETTKPVHLNSITKLNISWENL